MRKIFIPLLSNRGFIIPKSYLRSRMGDIEFGKLISELTVKKVQEIGPPKILKLFMEYSHDGITFLVLPRWICHRFMDSGFIKKLDVKMSVGHPVVYTETGELKAHQQIIVDTLMNDIYNNECKNVGRSGCTLFMGAGKGKTFAAAGIISRLGVTTLYIVPTKHLKKQAHEDMKLMFSTAKIYQVKGKEVSKALTGEIVANDFRNMDICICVINTALKMDDAFFSYFGFTIFDEIHMYCTPVFSKIFWKSQTLSVLGLTATPHRSQDDFGIMYQKCVGEIISAKQLLDRAGFIENDAAFTGDVDAIFYHGPPEYTKVSSRIIAGKERVNSCELMKTIISDPGRNKMIAEYIIKLHDDKDRNIFVFSEFREYLETIGELICAEIHEGFGLLQGGASDEQIAYAIGSRIILTTYGYSGTGISIKKMNTIVFVTPRRSNMIQILGRILRIGGDPTIRRKIVDVVDANTPFRAQFKSKNKSKKTRTEAYKYYGFPVKITHYCGDGMDDDEDDLDLLFDFDINDDINIDE